MLIPRRAHAATRLVAACCVATLLAGCGISTEEAPHAAPLVIAAADTPEQTVMAYLYAENLHKHGYPAQVRPQKLTADAEFQWLRDDSIDVVVSCTGRLLAEGSPAQATQLQAEAAQDTELPSARLPRRAGQGEAGAASVEPNPTEKGIVVTTYEEALSTLPPAFDVTDPSPTEACYTGGAPESLPQNVVAVFRKARIDRYQRKHLNDVSRLIISGDLKELAAEYSAGGDIHEMASQWHAANVH